MTSAYSEADVAGTAACFSSLSTFAAISANREEESWSMRSLSLSKPRSVFVFDLVEPERHLCERGAEVVHRGALLIAWARDRL
jgi:hypothetical protein